MEYLIIGLLVGVLLAYLIFVRFNGQKKKGTTETQSLVLMEKIRAVCKLITVEGDFSEIYHYEDIQRKWLNLLIGKKKALILIDAKAFVGFDLSKMKMSSDPQTKTITLSHFPQPELLTIETEFKYYDKKEGWANPFTAADLNDITKDAKQHIVDKIPGSGLMLEASQQALDTVVLMEKLVETINWKLDYSALKIEKSSPRKEQQAYEES